MDKKKLSILGLVIVLLIIGLGWYLYQSNLSPDLLASGTIEGTEVVVSSQVVGRVIDLKVREGDQVKIGDVLAQLDTSQLSQTFKSAQAQYKIAKDNYDRNKSLYADKLISPQQFDTITSNLEIASSALESARIQLDNATITAPISGTVLVKAIEKGELATVGSPIVTLADLSKVKLTVYVPERDVGKVQLGETVDISVDSYPNEKFQGKVIYISDKAEFTPRAIQTKDERVTQVFGIKIEIDNPGMKLKAGMPADADFKWDLQ
ncbi:MAG: efflux RND transporter periplasmic adaptor subunit [Candidatus Saganbacteria bacterium]|nr:efflux RND transporter periplasmic adaptor subunit [Candidatus Saganbacteria bacterium]